MSLMGLKRRCQSARLFSSGGTRHFQLLEVVHIPWPVVPSSVFIKDFIYLFLERGEGREGERHLCADQE